jgi:hypothetical protein
MRIQSRDNSVSLKKIFTVQDTLGDLDSHEYNITMSLQYHDGLVGMVMGYKMNSHGSLPGRAKEFSLPHAMQTGSGVHPASYPMSTRGSFSWGKAARV